jgi:glycosyltransferase involved in cell wall biosynthesis
MAINRNVYHLSEKSGLSVELVVPETLQFPSGRKSAEAPASGDPPIHYLPLRGENPRAYFFQGLSELLNEKKPRIIILDNDPVSRLALMVGTWSKQHDAKMFCISCENLSLDVRSAIKRRGWKSLPATVVKRLLLHKTKKVVNGVFTLSEDGRKIFTDEGYGQVTRIPLGFDPAYFFVDEDARNKIREELGLQKTVIAYFGRLTQEKGVHVLLKALERIKHYDWHLMMDHFDAYATGYSKEIDRLIREAGIQERVVYINPSHAAIARYMNASDIVVVPSISTPHWKEQYGRVAAEAMACGRLVVASDSGTLPELLNGNGLLFREGDHVALSDLLAKLLNTPFSDHVHAPSGKQISSYAREQLSIHKQNEIMLSIFNSSMALQ